MPGHGSRDPSCRLPVPLVGGGEGGSLQRLAIGAKSRRCVSRRSSAGRQRAGLLSAGGNGCRRGCTVVALGTIPVQRSLSSACRPHSSARHRPSEATAALLARSPMNAVRGNSVSNLRDAVILGSAFLARVRAAGCSDRESSSEQPSLKRCREGRTGLFRIQHVTRGAWHCYEPGRPESSCRLRRDGEFGHLEQPTSSKKEPHNTALDLTGGFALLTHPQLNATLGGRRDQTCRQPRIPTWRSAFCTPDPEPASTDRVVGMFYDVGGMNASWG